MRRIISGVVIAAILIIGIHYLYLSRKAPTEVYPDDIYLDSVDQKTALVIVAHDDDAISAAGTITRLCKTGWNVKELCFYNIVSGDKENERIRQRQQDILKVKELEGLSDFTFVNLPFRNVSALTAPEYMPLTEQEFGKQYNKDTILFHIRKFIAENRPAIIFTLDNKIGGYGHPDHVIVSRLVLEECLRLEKDSVFSVRYIYQAVFTPSMAKKILADMPVYKAVLSAYGTGMPAPDVQVNIRETGAQKKSIMEAYSTEQNSIQKIWPSYNYYPASLYFSLFDREFFKTIKLK